MLADAHCPTVARKRLRVEKPEKSMYSPSRLVQFIWWGGVFLLRVAYRTKWAVLAGAIDLMVLESVSLSHYVAFGGSPFASTGYGYAIGSKKTEVDGSVDDGPELSVVS